MNTEVSINGKCELVAKQGYLNEIEVKVNSEIDDIFNKCGYEDPEEDFVYIEFLVSPYLNIEDTLVIRKQPDYYVQALPEDGLYIHYCIKTYDSENIKQEIENGFEGLYFDSDKNVLLFKNTPVTDYRQLAKSLPLLMNEKEGVLDYSENYAFSICKLRNCVVSLQKKSIGELSRTYCKKATEIEKMRDFLFISIYILENLICQERYTEALDILSSISRCGYLCESKSSRKSNCNCNG